MGTWAGPNQPLTTPGRNRGIRGGNFAGSSNPQAWRTILLRRPSCFAAFASVELFREDETQHHVFEFAGLRGGAWWCLDEMPGRNGGCPPVGEFLVPGVKVTLLLSPVEI